MDQLNRTNSLSSQLAADLTAALDRSETRLANGGKDTGLAKQLRSLAATLKAGDGGTQTERRLASLGATLNGIADRLR